MDRELHGDRVLSDLMRERPQTVGVFVALRMACPGCAMSSFETVSEAAAEYGLDSQDLLARLGTALEELK